jgi:formamidopyrimidine-DNA glycosylase
MPELPEVETIRRDLEPLVVGRRITDIWVDEATLPLLAGPGVTIDALRTTLVGRTVTSLGRRGKYLLFGLDDGRYLVSHLRMTGRMVWRCSEDKPEPFERGRIAMDNGHDLRWSDLRKFGTWRIADDANAVAERLGPEPLDSDFALRGFRRMLQGRTAAIKTVLLDQRNVAGLGNIYVDEALFEARIRPETPAGELADGAIRRLFVAVQNVLQQGIEHRGASFRDYVDGQGNAGEQHMYVQVFRRTGKPCYVCGSEIRRIVVGQRSTHFCPRCQKPARRRKTEHEDR